MKRLILLAIAAAVAAACTNSSELDITGAWALAEGEAGGVPIAIVDTHPITLDVGESLGGSAGCNTYGAEYDLVGSELVVTAPFSTMMACEPAEVMDAETAYLNALGLVDTAAIEDGQLVLTGPDVALRFDA